MASPLSLFYKHSALNGDLSAIWRAIERLEQRLVELERRLEELEGDYEGHLTDCHGEY